MEKQGDKAFVLSVNIGRDILIGGGDMWGRGRKSPDEDLTAVLVLQLLDPFDSESGIRLFGFETGLYHFPAVRLWASYLLSELQFVHL